MNEHMWVGLATAFMDEDQAAEWAGVSGLSNKGLEIRLPEVICIICGAKVLEEEDACPGTTELLHRWINTLTLELDTAEVALWLEGADMEPHLRPRSNGLMCAVCGQAYERADTECPERVLYAKGWSE